MGYKGLKELGSVFLITPRKMWRSFIKSYRTSKLTLFLQTLNLILVIYIVLFILPEILSDGLKFTHLFSGESVYWVIMILVTQFIIWISSTVESLGYQILFETNRNITIGVLGVCLSIVALDKFWYKDLKNEIKKVFAL